MKKTLILLLLLALAGLGLAADGQQVYAQCAGCHQTTGLGITGAFPPLAKELPRIVAKGDPGRRYLVQVLLFGLQGPIVAQGKTYSGVMPSFGYLSDGDLAAVLNHALTAWGNEKLLPKDFKPLTEAEVKALRAQALSPQQVYENWKKLDLK